MTLVKQIIVGIVAVCSFQIASAQTNYTTYTIKSGETLSAIAKKYNTTVGAIMRLNGMHASDKINVGEKIKVPSTEVVTSARERVSTAPAPASTAVPVTNEKTHIVVKGETLFSISKKYGITVDQLKTWNHLTSDNTQTGTLLLIRAPEGNASQISTAQKQPTQAPAVQTQAPKQNVEKIADQINQVKKDTATTVDETTTMPNNSFASAMSMPVNAQIEANTDKAAAQQSMSGNYSGEGYFGEQFKSSKSSSLKTVSGVSKTFKTASGWSDGKYYILANEIDPGTIVKITADNGSFVYAKVLWNLGDMKDNAGINFRVSNATAAALKEDAASFNLSVSY